MFLLVQLFQDLEEISKMSVLTNATNFHARPSKSPESRLSTRSRSLGLVASSSTKLNVQGSDTKFLNAKEPTYRLFIWMQLFQTYFNLIY
jgi:hypothetical protein